MEDFALSSTNGLNDFIKEIEFQYCNVSHIVNFFILFKMFFFTYLTIGPVPFSMKSFEYIDVIFEGNMPSWHQISDGKVGWVQPAHSTRHDLIDLRCWLCQTRRSYSWMLKG
jgi:hypothetical protein